MLLNIDKVKPTAKSLVLTAGGKEYFAKKETGITAGMVIDAETKSSDYNGKTYVWIEKFKIANENHAGQGTASEVRAGSSEGLKPNALAPAWLPMASNVVAHALNAGVLKEPSDVKAWVLAVRNAVEGGPES